MGFGLLTLLSFSSWQSIPRSSLSSHRRYRIFGLRVSGSCRPVLSDAFLENDLVAIRPERNTDQKDSENSSQVCPPRLCVVQTDGGTIPLCIHQNDVETELFADPRIVYSDASLYYKQKVTDQDVVGQCYGEGFYGQRPVPSLGGGPGYGAEADEVWSVSEDLLERLRQDGVEIPVLDVGIAHGEKARGGAF